MPIAGNVVGSAGAVIISLTSRSGYGHLALNTTTQARISLALRQMYGNLVDLPLPERLTNVLASPKKKRPQRS